MLTTKTPLINDMEMKSHSTVTYCRVIYLSKSSTKRGLSRLLENNDRHGEKLVNARITFAVRKAQADMETMKQAFGSGFVIHSLYM